MTTPELSLLAFAACNALRLAAYLPQMVQLCRHPGAAPAFCVPTWLMFAAANASTATYAGLTLDDLAMALLHGGSAVCCGVLVGLALWRRRRPPAPR